MPRFGVEIADGRVEAAEHVGLFRRRPFGEHRLREREGSGGFRFGEPPPSARRREGGEERDARGRAQRGDTGAADEECPSPDPSHACFFYAFHRAIKSDLRPMSQEQLRTAEARGLSGEPLRFLRGLAGDVGLDEDLEQV